MHASGFPFDYEEAGSGFTFDWWYHGPVHGDSQSTFLRVVESGEEVARVHLDDEVWIDHYAGVPSLGAAGLAVQFIEVHTGRRLRGIGHEVIRRLSARHPDRRLIAFSEGADGFWSSLGWDRHLHADPEMAPRCRPLYIQSTK